MVFSFSEMTRFIPNSFSLSLEMLDYRSFLRSESIQNFPLLLLDGFLLESRLAKEMLSCLDAELLQLFSGGEGSMRLVFLLGRANYSFLEES